MSKTTLPRVAILGAGPIGLEAALYAKTLGFPVTLFEQGHPGAHVGRWAFVKMFTPFGMNVTSLGRQTLLRDQPTKEFPADTDYISGKDYRDHYLNPLAQSSALKGIIRAEHRILAIGRSGWRKADPVDPKKPLPPFRLLVREPKGTEGFETADVVIDCTGTLGRPNWVGDGGIPAAGETTARQHMTYWPEDVLGERRAHYAGKSVAVIGGGYTAATTVCDLASLAEQEQATWIVWLTNGPHAAPLPRLANDPLKERDRLAARANHLATRCDGNLEFHPQAAVDEVVSHGPDQGFRVTARVAGKAMTWEVDRVIGNVGYRPDLSICSELHVEEPEAELSTGEPGYFILGAKSLGRDSSFLIRDGHEQVRKTFAYLLKKPGFDLYAKAA